MTTLWLAGCGGGGGGDAAPVGSASPPASSEPTIGASGGTIADATGAQVIVPAAALSEATTIRIAKDSVGAPALPAGARLASPVYSLTPHGVDFKSPARLRIPFDATAAGTSARLVLLKAQPGGEWTVQTDVERDGASLLVDATTFSYYAVTFCEVGVRDPYCSSSNYQVTLDLANPAAMKAAGRGAAPAKATATVTQPRYVDLEVAFTAPTVAYGMTYRVVASKGRPSLPREVLSGALPATSPARLRVPVTEADNGLLSLWVEIACVAQPDPWRSTGQMLCDPGSDPRFGGGDIPVLPFRANSNVQLIQVSIPAGAPVGNLAPVISVQPQSQTAAEGAAVPVFSVETTTPLTRHFWEASFDGGATWRDLGSYPAKFTEPAGWPWCGASDPPCDKTPVLADPALQSSVVAPCGVAANTDCTAGLRLTARMNGRQLRARLVNDFGTTYSNVATLTVAAPTVPVFVQHPQNIQVTEGQTASFNIVTSSLPQADICWQSRASETAAWTDVRCPGSSTYTTAALGITASGAQFRAVASNGAGTATSNPASVIVTRMPALPSISTQPGALTVAAGSTALFATAIDGTAPLSYQWFRNGVAIAGANAPVLRLPAVAEADSGSSYALEIGNAAGTVRSSAAALTVTPADKPPAPVAPAIVTPPAPVMVDSGNTATFGVGVAGTGPFTYQWRKDGMAIAGATAAVYSLGAARVADQGAYSVVVSNSVGTVGSAAATLTVNAPVTPSVTAPAITTPPATLVVMPGGPATLAVAASGSGPLRYQWAKDGTRITGANGPVLQFASVSGIDAGKYTVTVSNTAGSVTSVAAELIVVGVPAITTQPAAQTATVGGTATFSVVASGNALRYQWTRNAVAIVGATAASYTTPALAAGDNGAVYGVLVYNAAGLVFSQNAVLTVNAAPMAQTVQASLTSAGAMPNGISYRPSLSADGTRVAFISAATNLIPGTVVSGHAYLRDLTGNTTTHITVRPDGSESSQGTTMVKLAANGRHVVFRSRANDLVAGDTNTADDVFVRDLQTQTTVRVNVLADGSQDTVSAGTTGLGADISADGRKVLMRSAANLAGDGGATPSYRWYLRDLDAGVTRLVAGSEDGQGAALSPDGRYVAFIQATLAPARNLLMLYDDQGGSTSQLLAVPSGTFPEGLGGPVAMSDNADAIAFMLRSSSVGGGAAALYGQIAVFERATGTLTIASRTDAGASGDGHSTLPSLSRDGRYVSFRSAAPNLSGDPASAVGSYLLVRDRQAGTTRIASRQPDGTPFLSQQGFNENALSADGSAVVHLADAGEVVPGALGGIQVYLSPRP
ncbi:MAG TPA: immunoglobulin domain-containing protein [Roseateles sp.]|uniref:immunoglobulin domain-containing protein n=1 Tax=Roseateles sp. TaxID=1971397 RepID=UPI002EDAC480